MAQHAEQSTWQAKPVMEKNKLGMVFFILSEAVFFGALILSYVYYRATVTNVAEGAKRLDVPLTALFTLALFSSSFTIWRADTALKNGQHGRLTFWLGATIALGLIFLVGQ